MESAAQALAETLASFDVSRSVRQALERGHGAELR